MYKFPTFSVFLPFVKKEISLIFKLFNKFVRNLIKIYLYLEVFIGKNELHKPPNFNSFKGNNILADHLWFFGLTDEKLSPSFEQSSDFQSF